MAAISRLPLEGSALAAPRIRSGEYPFKLGIASGDPTPDGVVLWPRLVPGLFNPDGGMPSIPVPVDWQVALDAGMKRFIKQGTVSALPGLAHSVHVEVAGLRPGREYYYRFCYRSDVSDVGRTRTAPLGSLNFAFASCQDWSHGFFSAYRNMAEENLDLVIHLGDYVYEYGVPADGGLRKTATPDVLREGPQNLDRWRMQYALFKSDPDLQRTHARFPWLVTWDDHEVGNDYVGDMTQKSSTRSGRSYGLHRLPPRPGAGPARLPPPTTPRELFREVRADRAPGADLRVLRLWIAEHGGRAFGTGARLTCRPVQHGVGRLSTGPAGGN